MVKNVGVDSKHPNSPPRKSLNHRMSFEFWNADTWGKGWEGKLEGSDRKRTVFPRAISPFFGRLGIPPHAPN